MCEQPIGKRIQDRVLSKALKCFVFDVEEKKDPEDQIKVVIHVTAEEYSYNRFRFVEDKDGDYIERPKYIEPYINFNGIAGFCVGELANDPNYMNGKQYFRISKTRYEPILSTDIPDEYDYSKRPDPSREKRCEVNYTIPEIIAYKRSGKGSFVKIATGELVVYHSFQQGTTPKPIMVNITGLKRYKKKYEQYNADKCFNQTPVTRHVKVPLEFGTYKMTDIKYNTDIGNKGNSGAQTKEILDQLMNYNKKKERVGYGAGVWFKNFKFGGISQDKKSKKYLEDGDYIEETFNAPDNGNKWSPDSGSTGRSSAVNKLPYPTYKAYFYRGDDPSAANSKNALQKLKEDIKNKNHNLAEKEGGEPIIFEIARYTRTNNFSYYRNGGPLPPNDYQGQPAFYEINKVGWRFRVSLREEDYPSNFQGKGDSIIQVATNTKKKRFAISLDLFSNSNSLEGCLGILGVLRNGKYTKLAGGDYDLEEHWDSFNEKLIKIIKELGEVYGYKDKNKEAKEIRTRVFLKADPLPDVPTTNVN